MQIATAMEFSPDDRKLAVVGQYGDGGGVERIGSAPLWKAAAPTEPGFLYDAA
ncbi:MAG TPA: hypothetical protein VFC29_13250 [Candidatus Limnocylindrales bacterium]|jgi:hypothetical protein|nr:hypothetical protein [Candidatus Limnocylindrales bacterium]